MSRAEEAPGTLPRLFIQGQSGGSLKMDLRGLGVELIPGAFAYVVPGESLSGLNVHRGDIAIVQPLAGPLNENDLLVVTLGLEDRIGQVTRKKNAWCLQTVVGSETESVLLFEQPVRGRVIGLMRMFVATQPVPYKADDAHFAAPREQSSQALYSQAPRPPKGKAKGDGLGQTRRARPARASFLAAEGKGKLLFSEVEGGNPYAR